MNIHHARALDVLEAVLKDWATADIYVLTEIARSMARGETWTCDHKTEQDA